MSGARPLEGRRVLVTRGVDKVDPLPGLLEAAGALVVRVPLIATEVIASPAEMRVAVRRLRAKRAGRRWMVLTSETAVSLVMTAVGAEGLEGVALAVVGPATRAAAASHGLDADLVASEQDADSLADELLLRGVRGAAVLVVAAAGGRAVIAPALRDAGALVEVVQAYRSVMPPGAAERLRAAIAESPPDAVIFTSGSTVRNSTIALDGTPPPRCAAVCIGPVTTQAAREAGWVTVVTAVEHTAQGLAAATVRCLAPAHPLP
jgi:uroporphyrinogen-III synthase